MGKIAEVIERQPPGFRVLTSPQTQWPDWVPPVVVLGLLGMLLVLIRRPLKRVIRSQSGLFWFGVLLALIAFSFGAHGTGYGLSSLGFCFLSATCIVLSKRKR